MRKFTLAAVVLTAVSFASADFLLIDDFEGYTLPTTAIDEDNGPGFWVGDSKKTDINIVVDPVEATNQLLSIPKSIDGYVRTTNPAVVVGASETATLFLRLRKDTSDWDNASDFYIGLAESPSATAAADLNFALHLDNGGAMKLSNGAAEDDLGQSLLQDGTWQNFWFVIDNAANTYSVYYTTGTDGATAADLLGTADLAFATATADDLNAFAIATTVNRNNDPLLVDDMYIDTTGANLGNPIPEPATMSLLALGGLAVLRRRRRA